jgi:hypothetical protein
MIKEFIMILQLALTGQHVAIDVASEEECRAAIQRIEAGQKMILTLKNGVQVPVERVLGCVSKKGDGGGVS